VEAALVKDLGTEFEAVHSGAGGGRAGDDPYLAADPGCTAPGLRQQVAPSYSLRGGTREILARMIARGLGLR